MLNRRLLYTAITRAKSGLVLLGERELLESALQKNDHHVRHTGLVDQLRRFFGPCDELEIPHRPYWNNRGIFADNARILTARS